MTILKIIPTMQSIALLNYNTKFLKKKKKKTGDFIEMGVGNIIGSTLTKETADFIGE
jgi:hypothetical protein